MKFSIVTACRNSAKTIGRTLASVTSQSDVKCEHIVIDGLSTDDTVQLVRCAAPDALLISEGDSGIYDAMNKGILKASGDVIAILNSDDHYCGPLVLKNIEQRFRETGADAIFADVAFFDPRRSDRIVRRYRSSTFTPQRIRNGIMPAHPGMFLRREIYERFGLYSHDFPLSADFEYVARLFSGSGIHYAFHPQVAVMMLPGGVSTSGLAAKWHIFWECLRACRQNDIDASFVTMLAKYPLKAGDYFLPRLRFPGSSAI